MTGFTLSLEHLNPIFLPVAVEEEPASEQGITVTLSFRAIGVH